MKRQHFLRAAAAAALATCISGAWAQSYPAKPVTIVIPFPPGGTLDVIGRQLAQKLGPADGPDLHRRQPAGRRGDDRRDRGEERRARRLHAALQSLVDDDHADDDEVGALRHRQGLRAGRARRQGAARSRDQQEPADHRHEEPGRLCQGQPRQDDLRDRLFRIGRATSRPSCCGAPPASSTRSCRTRGRHPRTRTWSAGRSMPSSIRCWGRSRSRRPASCA